MTATTTSPLGGVRDTALSIWHNRFAGPAIRVVLAYILLIEVADQFLFGRIDIPGLRVSWLELGRYPQSIPRGVLLGGAVIGRASWRERV